MTTKRVQNVLVIGTNEDDFDEYQLRYLPVGTVSVVYDYTTGDYSGDGIAIAITADGRAHEKDLGHCSCYGPFDPDAGLWIALPEKVDLVRHCEVDEMGVARAGSYDAAQWARLREGVAELVRQAAE